MSISGSNMSISNSSGEGIGRSRSNSIISGGSGSCDLYRWGSLLPDRKDANNYAVGTVRCCYRSRCLCTWK